MIHIKVLAIFIAVTSGMAKQGIKLREKAKAPGFFSRPNEISPQFCHSTLDIVHFGYNSLLASSALIIDQFITTPNRKLNASAERLLANLDLVKMYPRYPFPQGTATSFTTASIYLHQLCLAATTPTLLLWLMQSVSIALKKLCYAELSQHADDYHFVYGEKINLNLLRSDDPNQFNPYIGLALQRALGFEFSEIETYENKKLPRVFHASKPKASSVGLVMHWENGKCMCSAVIEHGEVFNPLMNHENTRFLYQKLQDYQPTLSIAERAPGEHSFFESYIQAKDVVSRAQFSLTELKNLYFDTLDSLFETKHQHNIRVFWAHLHPLNKNHPSSSHKNQSRSLEARIHEGLEELLCRLIALKIIPENMLDNESLLSLQHTPTLVF